MKSEPGSYYYKEVARCMERPPKAVVPRYLAWIMGGIGGFLALALVVILVLRRQVRIRTRHLVQANETLRESEEKFRNCSTITWPSSCSLTPIAAASLKPTGRRKNSMVGRGNNCGGCEFRTSMPFHPNRSKWR